MKILMVGDTIEDLAEMWFYGGLERQVMGTAQALVKRGHEVEIVNLYWEGIEDFAVLDSVDIVHIFNTGGPRGAIITLANLARSRGIPVVFSTVYWSPYAMMQVVQKDGVRVHDALMLKNQMCMAKMVRASDLLMPNAEVEAQQLFADVGKMGVAPKPYLVVPNAVDLEEIMNPYEGLPGDALFNLRAWERQFEQKAGYILCVGRIEWRKNQLGLLRAVRLMKEECPDKDVRVLLIGAVAGDGDLLRMVEREAVGVSVAYLGPLPPRVAHLAMRYARVYCQPSFYETPGLANIEAAALGVPLVCGSWGSEPEYFEPFAFFCEPDSPQSIMEALVNAWDARETERVQNLRDVVLSRYNYDRVGELVESGYRKLVAHS